MVKRVVVVERVDGERERRRVGEREEEKEYKGSTASRGSDTKRGGRENVQTFDVNFVNKYRSSRENRIDRNSKYIDPFAKS